MIDETADSRGVAVWTCLNMLDHTVPDRALRLHMARCGRIAVPSVGNDQGHGYKNFQRNCCVRSLLAPGAFDREHNKTAPGAEQAGGPPASTPLRSPRFLEEVKLAVSAVYMMRSYLWSAS